MRARKLQIDPPYWVDDCRHACLGCNGISCCLNIHRNLHKANPPCCSASGRGNKINCDSVILVCWVSAFFSAASNSQELLVYRGPRLMCATARVHAEQRKIDRLLSHSRPRSWSFTLCLETKPKPKPKPDPIINHRSLGWWLYPTCWLE